MLNGFQVTLRPKICSILKARSNAALLARLFDQWQSPTKPVPIVDRFAYTRMLVFRRILKWCPIEVKDDHSNHSITSVDLP